MTLVLAGLMIAVGLAFKLSAVPFHFWCPDVFEGAAAEVDAFLSVASKGAALALLVRVAIGVGTISTPAAAPAAASHKVPAHTVAFQQPPAKGAADGKTTAAAAAAAKPADPAALHPIRKFMVLLLAIMAAVTCTFGNLVAYGQTNIKRMLAYSTIAHAGYMIMAVAAAVQLSVSNPAGSREAVSALMFYLVAYVFMNLGAFAIVAFLRNAMGTEEIGDYAGLIRLAPLTSVALTAILISLIGIPPMVGFMGKFAIFSALVTAGGFWMIGLLVVASINTAISLIYYLRVAKVICIDAPPASRGPVSIGLVPAVYVLVMAVPVIIYGILPSRIFELAKAATEQLLM
jgi:NADH-quinone oxidoreductase subunit N